MRGQQHFLPFDSLCRDNILFKKKNKSPQAMRTVCEDKILCEGIFLSFDFLCRDIILCRNNILFKKNPQVIRTTFLSY